MKYKTNILEQFFNYQKASFTNVKGNRIIAENSMLQITNGFSLRYGSGTGKSSIQCGHTIDIFLTDLWSYIRFLLQFGSVHDVPGLELSKT